MSDWFGGKKATNSSSSENRAFPYLKDALGSSIGQVGQAGSAIANLLGLNGGQAQSQGFDMFRNSTGYQNALKTGSEAITGGAASRGLMQSGATLRGLQGFGQNLANSSFGQYGGFLQNLLNSGNQSASILSSAGNTSTSKGYEKDSKGIGAFFPK